MEKIIKVEKINNNEIRLVEFNEGYFVECLFDGEVVSESIELNYEEGIKMFNEEVDFYKK